MAWPRDRLGRYERHPADLHGRTIALDTFTAQALHARVGDEFHGWFGDGAPAVLRVVAIYRRGLGFAELTVPRDVLSPHTTWGFVDTVFVASTPAARPNTDAPLLAELGRRRIVRAGARELSGQAR